MDKNTHMSDTDYSDTPDEMDETDQEDSTPDSETVLVDKSVFGGTMPKPGDKVTFEFVREYEDEAELKVSSTEKDSDEGTMGSSDRDIERMAV